MDFTFKNPSAMARYEPGKLVTLRPKYRTLIGMGNAYLNAYIVVYVEGLWSPWSRDEDATEGAKRWYTPRGSSEQKIRRGPKWCAMVEYGGNFFFPTSKGTKAKKYGFNGEARAVINIGPNVMHQEIWVMMNDDETLGDNQRHKDQPMRASYEIKWHNPHEVGPGED